MNGEAVVLIHGLWMTGIESRLPRAWKKTSGNFDRSFKTSRRTRCTSSATASAACSR